MRVTLRGNPITLGGPEIKPGQSAPDFTALDNGLKPVKLSEAKGKVVILSAVPSLDTPTCDTETRRFNQEAAKLGGNVEVWTISMDLPFAQKRWCGAAGVTASRRCPTSASASFGPAYGVDDQGRPARRAHRARGLRGRQDGKVTHAEYVKEISPEPNYDAALAAARRRPAGRESRRRSPVSHLGRLLELNRDYIRSVQSSDVGRFEEILAAESLLES